MSDNPVQPLPAPGGSVPMQRHPNVTDADRVEFLEGEVFALRAEVARLRGLLAAAPCDCFEINDAESGENEYTYVCGRCGVLKQLEADDD